MATFLALSLDFRKADLVNQQHKKITYGSGFFMVASLSLRFVPLPKICSSAQNLFSRPEYHRGSATVKKIPLISLNVLKLPKMAEWCTGIKTICFAFPQVIKRRPQGHH
jgi:hypothetical protein